MRHVCVMYVYADELRGGYAIERLLEIWRVTSPPPQLIGVIIENV